MLAFIKGSSLSNIRSKLITIYALNVTDLILTFSLQGTGEFSEGNPLMAFFMQNTLSALLIKLLFPALLLAFLYLYLHKASEPQLRKSNLFINLLLLLYALINVSHIAWTIIYFSVKA